jgi:hypothetical protein
MWQWAVGPFNTEYNSVNRIKLLWRPISTRSISRCSGRWRSSHSNHEVAAGYRLPGNTDYYRSFQKTQEQRKRKNFWEELIAYFPWYNMGHIENDKSNNSSIDACVFVTAVTFLPSRCRATIRGFLPSRWLETIGRFLPSRYLVTIREYLPSRCLATIGFLLSRCLATTATWSYKPTFIFSK